MRMTVIIDMGEIFMREAKGGETQYDSMGKKYRKHTSFYEEDISSRNQN